MSIVLSLPETSPTAETAAATPVSAKRPNVRAAAIHIGQKTVSALWAWKTRLRHRAELRDLMERADDRMLSDVGLNRARLSDEAGRPFWRG